MMADRMANYPLLGHLCRTNGFLSSGAGERGGVHPLGIRDMIRRNLAKLVMRSYGDQEKMVHGNLYLCTGLEAGIEG